MFTVNPLYYTDKYNKDRIIYYIFLEIHRYTPGRWQSKMLLTMDERGSKIARNSVFDRHLSPVGRQRAIKNSVTNYFSSTFVDCFGVFYCRLCGVR